MLRMVRFGYTWMQWMTKNVRHKKPVKKESARREIDRLVDSLDFEPVNFNEKVCRLRRLMLVD